MANKIDKSELKKYFRSGSRPSQRQFEDLIDNCYNDSASAFVSGYSVLVDNDRSKTIARVKREAGKTYIVPFFERINMPHTRTFHYAIPVANVGSNSVLEKIVIDLIIPENGKYKVKDKNKEVSITQKINIEGITIYNGGDEIFRSASPFKMSGPQNEIEIGKSADQWFGIGIDITITYDINSEIAVSDQLDVTADGEQMLLHTFGNAGCYFATKN